MMLLSSEASRIFGLGRGDGCLRSAVCERAIFSRRKAALCASWRLTCSEISSMATCPISSIRGHMIIVSWISYPIVRPRDDNIGMTRRGQHKVVICRFDKAKVLVYNPTDITTSVGDVSSDSTSEHKV